MNIARRWLNGAVLPFHAWHELRLIRGRRFIFVPILINIAFAVLLFRYGLTALIVNWAVPYVDTFFDNQWQWVVSLTQFLLDALALVLVTFLAVRLGTIIGSPFYGMIAERIDQAALADSEIPELNALQSIINAIWFELRKFGLFVMLALLGLGIEFIPVIGPVIGAGWFVVVGGILALLDYTDVSLSRRGLVFRRRFRVFWRHFPEVFGFACVVVPLAGIPLLNMLTVPLCICAGVLLYVRYLHADVTVSLRA